MIYKRIEWELEPGEWAARGVTVKPAVPMPPELPEPSWRYSVGDCLLFAVAPQILAQYPDAKEYDGATVQIASLLIGFVHSDGIEYDTNGGTYRVVFSDGFSTVAQEYELRPLLDPRPRLH